MPADLLRNFGTNPLDILLGSGSYKFDGTLGSVPDDLYNPGLFGNQGLPVDPVLDPNGLKLPGIKKKDPNAIVDPNLGISENNEGQYRFDSLGNESLDIIANWGLNPSHAGDTFQDAAGRILGEAGSGGIEDNIAQFDTYFQDTIVPLLQRYGEQDPETGEYTNLAPDTKALHEAAQREFSRDIVPLAYENLRGGYGINSTTGASVLAEASADLTANLADLDYEAKDTAISRSLALPGLANSAFSGLTALKSAGSQTMWNYGKELEVDDDAEGERLYNMLIGMTSAQSGNPPIPYLSGHPPSGAGNWASFLSDLLIPGNQTRIP